MDTVRWGIIGCGEVTEKKSGPGFQKADGSRLTAVMRRDGEKAADYAARHGVPRWYDDADALIADPQVDAVYIATPPASHPEYTLKAARAGKPVYVEKPMAVHTDAAEEMARVCREAGVPLFVAFYRRALPRFLKIKELVDQGKIGAIRSVRVMLNRPPQRGDQDEEPPWRVRPEIAGGGYFLDLAPHTLDFLDFVLGPLTEVRGRAVNLAGLYPAEDTVSALFSIGSESGGALGVGSWCFAAGAYRDETELIGSEGVLRFSSFDEEPIELERNGVVERFAYFNPEHVQQPLIQSVVDHLLGRGTCPSTAESALRTVRVTDAILQSYYSTAQASR
jgi:predicted dehydrogenase